MAYQKQRQCIYCGKYYSTIHSSKMVYSDWGQYSITTTNGYPDGSNDAVNANMHCGQCDKTQPKISEELKKRLNELVKGK